MSGVKLWSVWAVWGRCNTESEARVMRTEAERYNSTDHEYRIAIFPHLEDRKYIVQFRRVDAVCGHNLICDNAAECNALVRPCGHRLEDAYPCCLSAGTLRIVKDDE